MVGVPFNKGCEAPLRRRIKCHKSRPGCQPCRWRGVQCAGYARGRRLHHKCVTFRERTQLTTNRASVEFVHVVPPQPAKNRAHLAHTSIDEILSPKLVAGALDQQYREAFCAFIDANFPISTYAYINRITVSWFDVARNHAGASGTAVDWALRSLGSLHIGRAHDDERQVIASREMYGHSLRHLAYSINKPSLAKADETLAAAILLGGYEMINSTGQASWLLHSRGISYLFCLRGPRAHTHGLGRNLLASFRGFLVFEALTRGEACFLERQEWREIIPNTIRAEQQLGKACGLGELIEYAFFEVAQCPGFLATTRALVGSLETRDITREELICRMTRCETALCDLQSHLSTGVRITRRFSDPENSNFIGLIPPSIADILGVFLRKGISLAIAMIRQLLSVLESDRSRRAVVSPSALPIYNGIWDLRGYSLPASALNQDGSNPQSAGPQVPEKAKSWLDPVCMSMGMS